MLLKTPQEKMGWQATAFELADAGGQTYSLDSLNGSNGLLIAFICNHCPYVKAIADRLAADAEQLQREGIGVVAINSNDFRNYPDDSPPNMKLFADKHGFTFPYLIDEAQTVARDYGAVCTPDFFGFNRTGKLHYRGRLDDAKMGDDKNRQPELLNAMRMIAETEGGPAEQQPSMGCSIKWK